MRMLKLKKKTKIWILAVLIAAVSVFGVAYEADNDFKIVKSLDIYYTLFRELNLFYVDNTDPEKLVKTSIDAMLESLDPYTVYIPESEMEDFKFMTTGQYGGIGAVIRKSGDYAVIADPYEDFPAVKYGLKAGDLILEIDGKSIKDKEISQVSDMLKGTPNTPVELTVQREGANKPFKKTLIRQIIKIDNVPYYGMVTDKIGYIRLSNFTSDASKEVKAALIDLKQNHHATSIILDLRGNPGGLLNESVEIANIFVPKGQEVVSTRGRVKQWDNVYITKNEPVDANIPLAILVNRGSASASEIVAGSMQDLDRGVIIGERTFGKGLVQTTRPLSYNAQLKVTTAKYYIPSGRCIQALDYSHRNPDGSVGNIPDSLISEFKTKNGRKVFDGGGVIPDIPLKPELLSQIAINLYSKNLIFDFATQFSLLHASIDAPEKFSISDEDYNQFIHFVEGKNFDYQTKTEETFEDLKKTAIEEKYYDKSADEFKLLEKKIAHNKSKDFIAFKDEIKQLLSEEIISRYYYQRGRIKYSIREDDQIGKAIELLNNHQLYISILKGTKNNNDKITAYRR